jgi:hypothetical protein
MDSLAEHAAKVYLTESRLFVGLAHGDTEVEDKGYRRQPAAKWKIADGRGESVVAFGPWKEGIIFDRVLLFDEDGNQLRSTKFRGGSFQMPAGAKYEHTTKITVIDVPD